MYRVLDEPKEEGFKPHLVGWLKLILRRIWKVRPEGWMRSHLGKGGAGGEARR